MCMRVNSKGRLSFHPIPCGTTLFDHVTFSVACTTYGQPRLSVPDFVSQLWRTMVAQECTLTLCPQRGRPCSALCPQCFCSLSARFPHYFCSVSAVLPHWEVAKLTQLHVVTSEVQRLICTGSLYMPSTASVSARD